ncbi:hypothetical protein OR263_07200 [Streptomyces sp. NEAU-H22]|uniref:hypothetical protein n=1 Tax=unclassified Streptomyces TaxID=2593676 RepID=UPI00225BABB0|nr:MULTISPECIES: hypothetical protein [unclassified Streptomyces]MCX3286500.1 hypothetical protein [Streptomyces sp. NEAU-H22]WMD09636.1 hypothetical protein Q7C01_37055 [Streptomyces sp. FXY-T5]
MIEQVVHTEPGGDPAAVGLALTVAYALHAPTGRAAETAPAATRRASRAGKARRRTVRR